jgi:hypothetical protein
MAARQVQNLFLIMLLYSILSSILVVDRLRGNMSLMYCLSGR